MLKRLSGIIFLSILIIIVVFGYRFFCHPHVAMQPVVEAYTVSLQTWRNTIQTVGSLSASQGIMIKSEISGRIVAIYFHSGENVKAGDPLLQLNPTLLQAKLTQTKVQAELSDADYKRALALYQQKVLAKADLDKVFATYQDSQAQEAQAQAALDQTLLRAPFSGKIGLRLVNQGDYIDPSKEIAHLDAIDSLRVDFRIPGIDAGKVKIGAKVLLHTDAYPNQTFIAEVYAIDSQIDSNTRSLGVRANLSNTQQQLLPGAFVNVALEITSPQQLATVPETAINTDATGSYVYRIVNHKALKTPVSILFQQDGKVALSGLHTGEQIISVGGFKVRDKTAVIIGK
jgi:membrane fusion protein, multidrug efflux system